MRTPIALALTAVAMAHGAALAQPNIARGAPDSPACREALAALDTSERTAAATRSPDNRRDVTAAQRRAALACLGGPDSAASGVASASRGGLAMPPADTPRIVIPPLPPLPSRPAAAPRAEPPPTMSPPLSVTACDAAGCWASDGSRLMRTGPNNYVGPSGLCTSSGALLQCTR